MPHSADCGTQFLHMNNAAYLQHAELARWEHGIATGFMRHASRERLIFLVASNAIRYRRELKPLQRFEVHTSIIAADERSMWMWQRFHPARSSSDEAQERAAAGSLCRAVLKRGSDVVSPLLVMQALGADEPTLADLKSASSAFGQDALATLEREIV